MSSRRIVVGSPLPSLGRAVGWRRVSVEYLPPASKPQRRRQREAPERTPLVYPTHETHEQMLAFEPCWIHGYRGRKDLRVVVVETPPIDVAGARLSRILIPSRIAYQLVIESIDVGRELMTPTRLEPMSASVFSDPSARIGEGLPVGTRVRMRIRNIGRRKVWFEGAISVEVHAAPEPIPPPSAFGLVGQQSNFGLVGQLSNGRHLQPLLGASPDQPFGWLAGPGSPLFMPSPAWVGPPPAPHERSLVSLEVDATSDLQALSGAVGTRVRVRSTGAIFVCEHALGALVDGLTSVRSSTPGCVWRLES